ncbi:uncharacterized protein PGTG_16294 [Puccinia graminis f. sp. tritici CRL 75-36-700-3]|uniref:Uncharacterized protein n=1 Tax=Puccinia graminis f. sp. tritici (strain CRL 75-36-700-3 / race SCCL) TaxID=418459 RepID=E3L173_PUCGT|nr:uncharacterized protein PGTG_16294 [Puccinia graminis f. sp. tritici CRL 75-36-700-3]EFP90268.2 hypothetical protein PGTG_16294 [Puccinia graminis f. sp. tritici CRL 75-36-700-3]
MSTQRLHRRVYALGRYKSSSASSSFKQQAFQGYIQTSVNYEAYMVDLLRFHK